jgi:hypothetical protein
MKAKQVGVIDNTDISHAMALSMHILTNLIGELGRILLFFCDIFSSFFLFFFSSIYLLMLFFLFIDLFIDLFIVCFISSSFFSRLRLDLCALVYIIPFLHFSLESKSLHPKAKQDLSTLMLNTVIRMDFIFSSHLFCFLFISLFVYLLSLRYVVLFFYLLKLFILVFGIHL